ncbi:hypothetical protein [Egibacter rhizosphaerae]|uniref:hypothetical protein n=1 Tax=Egibacter rhizosphaerae TaxID=1670831 RepID=UPI0013F15EB5|nr:hypothetical protein [Egibacter rhizosphaerae]
MTEDVRHGATGMSGHAEAPHVLVCDGLGHWGFGAFEATDLRRGSALATASR